MTKLLGSLLLVCGAVGLAFVASGQGTDSGACSGSACPAKAAAILIGGYGSGSGARCCGANHAVHAQTVSSEFAQDAKVACCDSKESCCGKGRACCAEGNECCAEGKQCCAEGKECCQGGACCNAEANAASAETCPKEGCGGKGDQKQAESMSEGTPARTVSYVSPNDQAQSGEKKEGKAQKREIHCPVMGGSAQPDVAADYREGMVFFCCPDCIGEFKKNTSKYATKANFQLASTKQYVQKACPLTGRPVAEDKKVVVAGIPVGVCRGGCESKIKGAENDEARLSLIFADTAFEKGFAKRSKPATKKEQGTN